MNSSWVRIIFHTLTLIIILATPFLIFQSFSGDYLQRFLPRHLVTGSLLIPAYLLNIGYLVPRLLIRGKYLLYGLSLVLCFFVVAVLFTYLTDLLRVETNPAAIFGRSKMPFPPPGGTRPMMFQPFIIFPMLILTAIGTGFEVLMAWEQQRHQKETIEKEKISAELSFLKSQINPHFLFNTLNNIYALAESKSEETTKAILLLSDLMRYMLYDSSVEKISLEKEIDFMENYIALQRLRLSAKKDISIDLNIQNDRPGLLIEPLLFIPFVENAFKHGITYQGHSAIKISLLASNNVIDFKTFNHKMPEQNITGSRPKHSGIGLKNVKRRLELLYPDKYDLVIEESEKTFETRLTLLL